MKKSFIISINLMLILSVLFQNPFISYGYNNNDKIRVVIDDNYPPYSFYNSEGELQGICIDLWGLYEDKTGIEVEIIGMTWKDALNSMKERTYDVIDTPAYSFIRDQYLDYSMPYTRVKMMIFFHNNISGINDVKSLRGFTVGVIEGDQVIEVLKNNGVTNFKMYKSSEEVVRAARQQEIVTFVMQEAPAFYYLYKYNLYDQYNYTQPLYEAQLFRAVCSGEKRLLKKINDGFDRITVEENNAVLEKWHGKQHNSMTNKKLLKFFAYGTMLTVFIFILLFLWNRALSSKVKKKTKELSQTIQVLKESEEKNNVLLEAFPDIFAIVDQRCVFLDYHVPDHQYCHLDIEVNNSVDESLSPELAEKFKIAVKECFQSGEVITLEYDLFYKNEKKYFEVRLAPTNNQWLIAVNRDITEKKKADERFYYASIHDSLTGLFNRYYYENTLKEVEKNGANSFCAVVVDVDGLKLINDTLGHYTGDEYLKKVSKLLVSAFPGNSTSCRTGGDEFCVILTNEKEEIIEGYIKKFKHQIELCNKDNEIPISISIGYSYSDDSKIDTNETIKEADNRMYREKLHRKQSTRSEIVQAMKHMFEARDFITEGHATRMEELSERLSRAAGVQESDIADIKLLAQFHDIGKVGIPDHILFKPSRLTSEEYDQMKRHTEIGHRIAISSADLLPIAEGILKHHENWDGTGYPFGLQKEDIPLECRILSITDAYDAMTNDRPYRKAISKEAAIVELKRCAGTQFDPELVEKFIQIVDEEN